MPGSLIRVGDAASVIVALTFELEPLVGMPSIGA